MCNLDSVCVGSCTWECSRFVLGVLKVFWRFHTCCGGVLMVSSVSGCGFFCLYVFCVICMCNLCAFVTALGVFWTCADGVLWLRQWMLVYMYTHRLH
jgi:hypothetical protein